MLWGLNRAERLPCYDAYTAPMLVTVISLQFLPLLHHNYSFQITNLSPQITGWLIVTKRASKGTARGQVAAYRLSLLLLQLLLCSINTSLSHIGDVGKSIHYQYCYTTLRVTAHLQLPLEGAQGLNAPENKIQHLEEVQQMNSDFNQTLRGR